MKKDKGLLRTDKSGLLLFLMNMVLCMCAMELFIRSNPRYYSEGYRASADDRIVYELQPNYVIKSLNASISAQGLHDRYFPLDKPKGMARIAVIGDSLSFGWKVGAERSFPKMLEKMLNTARPGKFEVINFSVPGYNTSQEFEVLRSKVIKFNPDMVILCYSSNDACICNYIKSEVSAWNFLM